MPSVHRYPIDLPYELAVLQQFVYSHEHMLVDVHDAALRRLVQTSQALEAQTNGNSDFTLALGDAV